MVFTVYGLQFTGVGLGAIEFTVYSLRFIVYRVRGYRLEVMVLGWIVCDFVLVAYTNL